MPYHYGDRQPLTNPFPCQAVHWDGADSAAVSARGLCGKKGRHLYFTLTVEAVTCRRCAKALARFSPANIAAWLAAR